MKEISLVEFHREQVIYRLEEFFHTKVYFNDVDHEFYYLREKKDFYNNTFYRKTSIVFLPELDFGYGDEFGNDEMLLAIIRFVEEIPFNALLEIVEYYKVVLEVGN